MTRFDDSFAPIAVATRSGVDESLFHGVAVALAADGSITASLGDASLPVYPRSSLKPLQAAAMVQLGLELPEDLLAIVCASHVGLPEHLDAVRRLLARFDLGVDDLRNTPSLPDDERAREAALRERTQPTPLLQNCSGKHAGMLATCRINGWPIDGYLEPDHPLQEAITASIDLLDGHVHHVGIDGCGAPTQVLALDDLARAYARTARSDSAVARSMMGRPELVGGPGSDVTLWMRAVPGLIMKEGADGVMAGALVDGRAFSLKIASGSDAARKVATAQALRMLGVDVDAVAADVVQRMRPAVLGHGRPVGRVDALGWTSWSS